MQYFAILCGRIVKTNVILSTLGTNDRIFCGLNVPESSHPRSLYSKLRSVLQYVHTTWILMAHGRRILRDIKVSLMCTHWENGRNFANEWQDFSGLNVPESIRSCSLYSKLRPVSEYVLIIFKSWTSRTSNYSAGKCLNNPSVFLSRTELDRQDGFCDMRLCVFTS